MVEFLEVANELIILLTGFLGLIGTAAGIWVAVKSRAALIKNQNKQEQLKLLLEMADAAMTEAEASALSGEDKKTQVLDSIEAAAKAADIDISAFADQLSVYIDQTISFVNKMNTAKNN